MSGQAATNGNNPDVWGGGFSRLARCSGHYQHYFQGKFP